MPFFNWMNNSEYLAQSSHFAFGYAIIMTAMAISLIRDWGWSLIFWVLGIGVALASLKEFWFDMVYEIPKQTWGDSILDFSFYMIGAATGLLITYILVDHLVRKPPVISD
jgi:hypothetical protein